MSDIDFIEFGDSGWVYHYENDTWTNVNTGEWQDSNGVLYDEDGEIIHDPIEDRINE